MVEVISTIRLGEISQHHPNRVATAVNVALLKQHTHISCLIDKNKNKLTPQFKLENHSKATAGISQYDMRDQTVE